MTYLHFHPLTMFFLYYIYLNWFLILIIIIIYILIIWIRLSLKLIRNQIISRLNIFILHFSLLLFNHLLNLRIICIFLIIELRFILFNYLVKHLILNWWIWSYNILFINLSIRLNDFLILLIILFFVILLVILWLFILIIIANIFHMYFFWSFYISVILSFF